MIRFSKYIWLYILISSLVIIPGVVSLLTSGLRPSIDFTGGALVELKGQNINKEVLESVGKDLGIGITSIQQTNTGSFIVRVNPEGSEKLTTAVATLSRNNATPAAILRSELVGPVLGQELLKKAVVAAVIAIFGILFYVAYAFKNITYGLSAVFALVHDMIVVVGLFSLFGRFLGVEVDTLFVTAFLTTMSFSVHDTIVVFDRIREMQRKGDRGSFEQLADKALTQTMSRSLANSVTIIIMLLALVLLGGDSIRWFAVALLIGTISGTYSSPFVATPMLVLLKRLQTRRTSKAL
jgi:preprotein translocase subunit SecF